MKKLTIKFTKDDISNIYIDNHKWDCWVVITLESGSEIRIHSGELKDLILNKHKSYTAVCTHKHYWLLYDNGKHLNE